MKSMHFSVCGRDKKKHAEVKMRTFSLSLDQDNSYQSLNSISFSRILGEHAVTRGGEFNAYADIKPKL